MRNLRFAHKVENHSRRLVYDKLMVFIDSSSLSLCIKVKELSFTIIAKKR